jgi:hypothetical protein
MPGIITMRIRVHAIALVAPENPYVLGTRYPLGARHRPPPGSFSSAVLSDGVGWTLAISNKLIRTRFFKKAAPMKTPSERPATPSTATDPSEAPLASPGLASAEEASCFQASPASGPATMARPGRLRVTVDIKLVSVNADSNLHWRSRWRRRMGQRRAVARALSGTVPPAGPWTVTITRCGPVLMDSDNATGAAKSVRDEVACYLGVDDKDARIRWVVRQRRVRELGPLVFRAPGRPGKRQFRTWVEVSIATRSSG